VFLDFLFMKNDVDGCVRLATGVCCRFPLGTILWRVRLFLPVVTLHSRPGWSRQERFVPET
jgi:hypothetical protein